MSEASELLQQLVAIDSVNPSLVPGAAGEGALAQFVARWLVGAGVEIEIVEPTPGRPSVLGRVRGFGGGRSLMLYAHLDTVGVDGMAQPHQPVVRENRLYGRGAYDMKGGLATIMLAAARAARGPRLPGDVWLMAVADEEHSSLGAEAVLARLNELKARVDGGIVTEPTDMKLCLAQRGFAWATVTTHGRAAHTSRRGEGVDAIAHMGRVVVALEQLDRELQARPAHPLLGHGSVVASLIRGGSELFTYPAHCEIELVRRTLPGETDATVRAELQHVLAGLSETEPHFSGKAVLRLYRAPLEIPAASPIVQTLGDVAERVLGERPPLAGATFWTDVALLAEAGIPSVIFGPVGAGLHSTVEWVDLPSLEACAEIVARATQAFCGAPGVSDVEAIHTNGT